MLGCWDVEDVGMLGFGNVELLGCWGVGMLGGRDVRILGCPTLPPSQCWNLQYCVGHQSAEFSMGTLKGSREANFCRIYNRDTALEPPDAEL